MIAAAGRGAERTGFRPALHRAKAVLLASLVAAALSACKTAGTTDAVETTAAAPTATPAASGPGVFGTGPIAIALFTDSMGAPQLAADQRDGAALAVNQLAKDQITLTVYDAGPNGADIGADVKTAIAAGAKLLVGPPSLAGSPAWAKLPAAQRPPAILLSTAPQKPAVNTFWLVSSESDSAMEAAGYAVNAGKKQILVASAAPLAPAELTDVKNAVERSGGIFLGSVAVPSAIKRDLLPQAEAVLMLGAAPNTMLAPLREAGLGDQAWILGTSSWTRGGYVEGGYFAAIDQNGFNHIAGRFQTAYGRKLSADAAYAFDAVAVAAGIVRAKAAISAAELKSETGFSGATGPFRFTSDGRVERRFSIYKVEALSPKLHDPAPGGF
jgi:hypothetical protein